jgi:hypothetical protein
MTSTFKDRRRCFVRDRLAGASLVTLLCLCGCSSYEEQLTDHFVLMESPSGLESISIIKNGKAAPKIPAAVLSILKDDENFYITRQDVQVAIKADTPSLRRMESYQYFILSRKNEALEEVSGSTILGRITHSKSKIVSVNK